MVVKVSKPEINVREKISELDKPSGTAGQAMLAAETPQEQFNLISAGRRNLIINGGFDVWQRGTTINSTDYSADRWMQWMTNSGVSNRNVNCTQQTGGPTGRNSSYIRYAPQVVDTGMEKFAWGQKIEKSSLDHIESGQFLTLSFWIKKEQNLPVDNNMDIQILYPDSTNTWSSGYLFRNDENIDQTLDSISFNSLSTEWTKYSYTFVPGDTALDRGLAVYWHVGDTNFNLNNTNALISFTGVQLEVGKIATPFEYRSYSEEFALCQRYYQRFDADGQDFTNIGIAVGTTASSQTKWYVPIVLPGGRMRTDPSLSFSAASDFRCTLQHSNSNNCSSIIIGYGNPITPNLAVIAGSNVAGVIRMFGYGANTTAFLAFDAEL